MNCTVVLENCYCKLLGSVSFVLRVYLESGSEDVSLVFLGILFS